MNNSRPLNGLSPTHCGEHICPTAEDWELTQATHTEALGLERAALANPDLPTSFVTESLMSMAEPREDSLPFVPRSGTHA